MNPKQYEFFGSDRVADMRRSVVGDQRIARARDDAQPATSVGDRRGWTARARRLRLVRPGDLIARVIGG